MRKDHFTTEALATAKALVALKYSENSEDQLAFSEAYYDFTRCQRPDGSIYGTGGSCRKGTEAGAAETASPKTKSQVSLVTPQATTQADVDRIRNYRNEQQARVKTIGQAMAKNPDARKDPKVMKNLELAIRNVEAANRDLSKAMDNVGKQGLKSSDREKNPKELTAKIKDLQARSESEANKGFRDRALQLSREANKLMQEKADLQKGV